MKTTIKTLQLIFLSTLLLFILGCSKDSVDGPGDGEIQETNGISAEELDNYSGDLGLFINTRNLVKKGYNPVKVTIETNASEGDYDQELNVDLFTNIAKLSLAIDDLSSAAEAELREGVSLDINILDQSNSVITSKSFSIISFEENGNQIDIDASDLEDQLLDYYFNGNIRHYLQLVDAGGNYNNKIVSKPGSGDAGSLRLREKSSSFGQGVTSEQFYIYKYPNANEYALYSAITNRYLTIGNSTRTFRQSGAFSYPSTSTASLEDDYRFVISKENNGLYTLRGASDNKPLRRFSEGGDINWHTNDSGTIQYFKIIALDINWDVTELNTEYLQPILPTVETSFGFNSTLKNCGSGSLEQEVGLERTVTTSFTSGFSESIGLSSRVTTSVDVSVSATAEASFFGNGGSVTGEVSTGLEVSVEASSTTTNSSEQTESVTDTFFSNRTVVVPAGSASLVYDAYQTYSDVSVPYVKRLRLRGNHSEGASEPLSGEDIATQLKMTNFSGVITNIGSDFVEITIEGNMILDNIVDTQTEVRDVAANCD